MIPKKIQLNFYGILTRKKLIHKFDTKKINLLSFACQNCYQKTLSYGKKSTCQKSLGRRTRFTSQNFLAKCAVFGRNNSGTSPKQTSISPSFIQYRNGKKEFVGNPKFGGKKLMLWGFIAHDGRKCLQKVYGTINSIKYLQILQERLLPEMFLGKKLQQDNTPAHNSILSKTWFSRKWIRNSRKLATEFTRHQYYRNCLESAKEKSFPTTSQKY